jgi:hypothetical protein
VIGRRPVLGVPAPDVGARRPPGATQGLPLLAVRPVRGRPPGGPPTAPSRSAPSPGGRGPTSRSPAAATGSAPSAPSRASGAVRVAAAARARGRGALAGRPGRPRARVRQREHHELGQGPPRGRRAQVDLVAAFDRVEGLERVRLMYLQPAEIIPELLDAMAASRVVAPYYDLSLQHASGPVLDRMARSGPRAVPRPDRGHPRRDPGAVFRSSFIVGFPGETEDDVEVLEQFLEAARLDWAGVFTYSPEDGTPSATMPDQVDPDEARCTPRCAARCPGGDRGGRGRSVRRPRARGARRGGWRRPAVGRSYREAPETDGEVRIAVGEAGAVGGCGPWRSATGSVPGGRHRRRRPPGRAGRRVDPRGPRTLLGGQGGEGGTAGAARGPTRRRGSARCRGRGRRRAADEDVEPLVEPRQRADAPAGRARARHRGAAGRRVGTTARWWAFGIFVFAALTDSIDGWVARKMIGVTRWGQLADPAADKALIVGSLAILAYLERLPWWAVAVIVVREVAVTLQRHAADAPRRRHAGEHLRQGEDGVAGGRGDPVPPAGAPGGLREVVLWVAVDRDGRERPGVRGRGRRMRRAG